MGWGCQRGGDNEQGWRSVCRGRNELGKYDRRWIEMNNVLENGMEERCFE